MGAIASEGYHHAGKTVSEARVQAHATVATQRLGDRGHRMVKKAAARATQQQPR